MAEPKHKAVIRTKSQGEPEEHRRRLAEYVAFIDERLPESEGRRSELEFREILGTLMPVELMTAIRRGQAVVITRGTLREIRNVLEKQGADHGKKESRPKETRTQTKVGQETKTRRQSKARKKRGSNGH